MKVIVTPRAARRVSISPRPTLLLLGDSAGLTANVIDVAGDPQFERDVTWSGLDQSIATVDKGGVVRARADGRARIVATVDAVSDTTSIVVARAARLSIDPKLTSVDAHIASIEFSVTAYDALGVLLGRPWARWDVSGPASLSDRVGPTTRVSPSALGTMLVSVSAGGLVQSLSVKLEEVSTMTTGAHEGH